MSLEESGRADGTALSLPLPAYSPAALTLSSLRARLRGTSPIHRPSRPPTAPAPTHRPSSLPRASPFHRIIITNPRPKEFDDAVAAEQAHATVDDESDDSLPDNPNRRRVARAESSSDEESDDE